MSVKKILLLLLPPGLVLAVRWFRLRFLIAPEWQFIPAGKEAWKEEVGWKHETIAAAQKRGWDTLLDAVNTPQAFGDSSGAPQGGTIDVGQHNNILTFGYVLGRVASGVRKISVLDWGGGAGQYHVYARRLLPETEMDYVVKEVETLCEAGRSLQPKVQFTSSDAEALTRRYDLVFASSALQYSRDYYGTLSGLCGAADKWLMVTRSPFVEHSDDFAVRQRPHAYGYMTEYMAWFVNRRKFVAFVEAQGFALDREFLVAERPFVPNAPEQCQYCGFLFRRK